MSALSHDELVDLLRRSGLVAEERLAALAEEPADNPEDMLARLEYEGLITAWHRERLLAGKWKGFFLGRYKVLTTLGAGAMGTVFLAEHKVMRHRVAIKVLARRLLERPSNLVRFEREARAAAAINHPNVVRAYDIDHEGDTHFLVMEYVQGENLQQLIERGGPLEPRLAADYARQIALGLHEAHGTGLVHRDIKPSNVLLDQSGVVKLLDLGLARLENDDLPSVTLMDEAKVIGTVDYLAPEQALNSHRSDSRADIYSLGCTLYYLLTGVPPFPSGSVAERILKHQTRRPRDIRKRQPGVPDALVSVCNRLMEKLPERRFATAGEAAAALAQFLSGQQPEGDDVASIVEEEDELLLKTVDAPVVKERAPSPPAASASPRPAAPKPAPSAASVAASVSIFDGVALAPLSAPASVFDGPAPTGDTLISGPGSTNGNLTSGSNPGGSHPALAAARAAVASSSGEEKSDGDGINYPLWFLLIAGVILGLILAGVGFSYVSSFQHKQEIKVENREK